MITLITGRQKHAVRHGSMETTFALGKNGNLIANTSVRNRSKFRALIGGVIILFLDEDRHPIWTSHAHRYGVEGCWIGECDRNQNWTDEVPIDILPQIRGYSILQNQDLRWLDMMGQRRQRFAQWLQSDNGKETLDQIQRTAVMLQETERLLLQTL